MAMLKEIGDALVDIHGQHAHQSLLNPRMHLPLLDQFAGAEALQVKKQLAEAYHAVTEARRALESAAMDERERAQKCDLYAYQLREISQAALQEGEEETLLDERRRLTNAQAIMEALGGGTEGLSGDAGALAALSVVLREIEGIRAYGEAYAEVAEKLQESYYALEDAAYTLRELRDGFSYDPQSLDAIEWRLELISQLKRKYGATIAEILAYAARIETEYEKLLHAEEHRGQLQETYERALSAYAALAERLSALRKAAAARLSEGLLPQMADLGMPGAAFLVQMERLAGDAPSATGYEMVEFLLSANPGEPPKPLSRVASGGEISRIMLAFKTVLASADGIPTMVFDEIDSGISGQVGTAVAKKMRQIARAHQVLCVTHLAQIAAHADAHYFVKKQIVGERTVSSAERLEEAAHFAEIARIMGSEPGDAIALRHAKQLVLTARQDG